MSHDITNDFKASNKPEYREHPPSPSCSSPKHAAVDEEYYEMCPNTWARWRRAIREPLAEFLGTMVLVLFGDGAICQVVLGGNPAVSPTAKGAWLSIPLGWGTGAALGVWIAGGISGGHINPAVTLAMATFRGFPWRKVPVYMFAQLMGALVAAAVLYGNYYHAINIAEGGIGVRTVPGTAGLFATYPLSYMTAASAFFNEFLATSLLVMVVFAVTDNKNLPPTNGMLPLAIFFVIFGIGTGFGMQTGFAINPARDLGPRLMTAMAGYGAGVFNFRNQYWIWCPILGPLIGGLAGGLVYDTFVFTGLDSFFNKPNAEARAVQESARKHKVAASYPGQIV